MTTKNTSGSCGPSAPCAETAEWFPASLTEQAEVIAATHHAYLRRELPRLASLVGQVRDRHGHGEPALDALCATFDALRKELVAQLDAEEQVLFPKFRRLEAEGRPSGVAVAVRVAECGHAALDRVLDRVEALLARGGPPVGCCAACGSLRDGLGELGAELRRHIRLERGHLFRRAVAAEARVLDRQD